MVDIGGKNINDYMSMVKIPLIILIAIALIQGFISAVTTIGSAVPALGFFAAIVGGVISLLVGLLSIVVFIGVCIYAGFTVVKKHSGNLLTAAVAGGILGTVSGLVSGLIGLLVGFIGAATGEGFAMLVFPIIGLILSPIVSLVVGAICSLIGGLIAGARDFK